MFRDSDCCHNVNCGCSLSSFVPSSPKECPNCQELMWVVGRRQLLELRVAGQNCGYQGHLLSGEEIVELV